MEHRRVLGGVRLAAQVLPQVEQLVVVVRGGAERDAGKPRPVTEGDVELDGAVLEAAAPQPGGAFTQQQGGAPAIGLDARLSGVDGPRGFVERLLGARSGGERRDGQGEQRAEAREAGSVGFHAPTLARLVAGTIGRFGHHPDGSASALTAPASVRTFAPSLAWLIAATTTRRRPRSARDARL